MVQTYEFLQHRIWRTRCASSSLEDLYGLLEKSAAQSALLEDKLSAPIVIIFHSASHCVVCAIRMDEGKMSGFQDAQDILFAEALHFRFPLPNQSQEFAAFLFEKLHNGLHQDPFTMKLQTSNNVLSLVEYNVHCAGWVLSGEAPF